MDLAKEKIKCAKVIPNLFDFLEKELILFNHSSAHYMKSILIIYSKSAKLISMLISLCFFDKTFESYSFGWKKDLLKLFLMLLFNKRKILESLLKVTKTKPLLFFQKISAREKPR